MRDEDINDCLRDLRQMPMDDAYYINRVESSLITEVENYKNTILTYEIKIKNAIKTLELLRKIRNMEGE